MNTVTAVYTICPLQDLLLEIKDMLHTVVSLLKQGSGSAMRVTCKKEEGGDAYIVSIPRLRLECISPIGQSLVSNSHPCMFVVCPHT